MSTELSVMRDYPPAEVTYVDPTGGRLVAWAQAAAAAHSLAKSLSNTSFVPAAFKGNPGDATAAVLMGDELGLSPLAALRSIFVIHGQPAMYARTMVALAQSHGHSIWTEKSTEGEVIVCGQRRGSEHVERSVWTTARATKAGYTSNRKYSSNSQEMLYAKASAEIARKIAADVLAGVGASVEDLEMEPPADAQPATPPPTTTRVSRARKAPEPAPIPEPDLEPEPQPELPTEPEPDDDAPEELRRITGPQSTKMHAIFRERGWDRDAGLKFLSDKLGFPVTSSKELTKDEASFAIDALERTDPDA